MSAGRRDARELQSTDSVSRIKRATTGTTHAKQRKRIHGTTYASLFVYAIQIKTTEGARPQHSERVSIDPPTCSELAGCSCNHKGRDSSGKVTQLESRIDQVTCTRALWVPVFFLSSQMSERRDKKACAARPSSLRGGVLSKEHEDSANTAYLLGYRRQATQGGGCRRKPLRDIAA